jgi:hypothetical protein
LPPCRSYKPKKSSRFLKNGLPPAQAQKLFLIWAMGGEDASAHGPKNKNQPLELVP